MKENQNNNTEVENNEQVNTTPVNEVSNNNDVQNNVSEVANNEQANTAPVNEVSNNNDVQNNVSEVANNEQSNTAPVNEVSNNSEVQNNVSEVASNEQVNTTPVNEVQNNTSTETTPKKNNNGVVIALILLVIAAGICIFFILNPTKKSNGGKGDDTTKEKETVKENKYAAYQLNGNNLQDFDLYFLQLENEKKNKVYSPLSIKYALSMLENGANGETKEQISNIIGTYSSKKYVDSKNMSFANALFIKDSFKNSVKSSYIDTLTTKYNAEVIYDSFTSPNTINNCAKKKTFNLIDGLVDDVSSSNYVLVNALAIDMEWVNKIQSVEKIYSINYAHRDFSAYVGSLSTQDYHALKFKDVNKEVKSAEISAVINKYDIIKEVGEDKIRETVGNEYQKWLNSGAENSCNGKENEPDKNTYVNTYIKEISEGYKDISSSTDFEFYTDENVKMFAKDLKQYDGTTLQYIGIMPIKDSLDNYIKNAKAEDISKLIGNLKKIELDNFKEGVITEITGYIPMFKFEYELKLKDDLKTLGIENVFDDSKVDLSNISTEKASIGDASHKANIEFSNDGIKAAAATSIGGLGAADCGFDYIYKVPVEKIDLTFDNPYMFIIRDKDTGEVWFTGTVYEPVEHVPNTSGY